VAGGASEAAAAAVAVAALLDLRNTLALLPQLAEALGGARCDLLVAMRDAAAAPQFSEIVTHVSETVDESDDGALGKGTQPLARLAKALFAVKPGRCHFLDISRHAFCEAAESVAQLVEGYNAAQPGLAVTSSFASKRGFFLKCSAAAYEAAPPAAKAPFIQAARRGKQMQLSSAELNALNARLLDAAADAMLLSCAVLEAAVGYVRERLQLLRALAEAVALLDLTHAFASAVAAAHPRQWIRPAFTTSGPLAIKSGRHPVLERGRDAVVVPNHFFLTDAASLIIVNGANASGKTTYLRTCATLALLAHVGCFVPAAFASFRLLDSLLCVGLTQSDDVAESASTFTVECRELSHTLAVATPNSLVIIDELGRATSSADSYALCRAAAEALLSCGALTLCATHHASLRELATQYPNCKTARLEAVAEPAAGGARRLRFVYTLVTQGPPPVGAEHYGLMLAADAGFSAELLAEASAIASRLEASRTTAPLAARRGSAHADYAIAQRLAILAQSGLGDSQLREALVQLKAAAMEE